MESNNYNILVPYDLTELSNNAIQHAMNISKHVGGKINVAHFVTQKSETNEKTKQIKELISKIPGSTNFTIDVTVSVGKISNAISDFANNNTDISFAVMKTDGLIGMQKYTTSHPVRLMAASEIPFIVIQKAPEKQVLTNVLSPIDFRKENKEKLNWIIFLAKWYPDCKFYLFKAESKDKLLKKRIQNNLMFSKQILDKKEIKYEVVSSPPRVKFSNAIIEFGKEINTDLIMLMVSKNQGLTSYLMGLREQYIIANKYKIPVMCINPRADLHKFGGFY